MVLKLAQGKEIQHIVLGRVYVMLIESEAFVI